MSSVASEITLARPATGKLTHRFFWKESRRLLGLALGVAGLTLVVMLLLQAIVPDRDLPKGLTAVAFGGAAMMAVAAAVTLFSVEEEEGTAGLLRLFPRNRVATPLGKVAAAVVVTIALAAVLCGVAGLIAGGWPRVTDHVWSQGAIAVAEAFVWALLASLLVKNPLLAAVLGMAGASLNSQIVIGLLNGWGYTAGDFATALPGRWWLAAVVALLDGWLGTRWLDVSGERRPARARRVAAREAAVPRRTRRSAFVRLLWQSVRQSWWVGLAAAGLGVFLTVAYVIVAAAATGDESAGTMLIGVLGSLFAPALLGAVVFRADQRGGQHLFLAEHAGRPRLLWLARLATFLVPLVVFGAAARWVLSLCEQMLLAAGPSDMYWDMSRPLAWAEVVGADLQAESLAELLTYGGAWVLWAGFAAFCWGQFFSLALRSDILAGMLALGASVVLAAWSLLAGSWLLPPSLFAAPLGFGALAATWLRAPAWMFGRHGPWRWAAPLLALVLPVVVVLGVTPWFRWQQVAAVPLSGPSVTFDEVDARDAMLDPDAYRWKYMLPEGEELVSFETFAYRAARQRSLGRETADAYERLTRKLESGYRVGDKQTWGELNRLSRRKCVLPWSFGLYGPNASNMEKLIFMVLDGQADDRDDPDRDRGLEEILLCRRIRAQRENGRKLDYHVGISPRLSDELLDWATTRGQTVDRLLGAIAELKEIESLRVGPAGWLMNDYADTLAVVRGEEAPHFMRNERGKPINPSLANWLVYLAHRLPGEQARAERALKVLTLFQTLYVKVSERTRAMRESSPGAGAGPLALDGRTWQGSMAAMLALGSEHSQMAREKLWLHRHAETSHLINTSTRMLWRLHDRLQTDNSALAWRRAERVRLALIAYRLKEGDYPGELTDLTPDYLAPEECRDPNSGELFGYEPRGVEHRTWSQYGGDRDSPIAAGTPLLWCGGVTQSRPVVGQIWRDTERTVGRGQEALVRNGAEPPEGVETETVMHLWPEAWQGGFWMPLPK